jgi:hypothetical protein
MEDIGTPPYESLSVEVWIHGELKNRKEPAFIADQLFKNWEKGNFNLGAKKTAGQFCFQNGFLTSLLRVLKSDLVRSAPLPWGLVYRLLVLFENPLPEDLADALVTGATQDKQLHELAAEGVSQNDPEKRWKTLLASEQCLRVREANENRQKIIEDLKIFRVEGMDTEIREGVSKLLALFPDDRDGQTFAKAVDQKKVEKTIRRLRQTYGAPDLKKDHQDAGEWPELASVLGQAVKNTDLESAYTLSIGLHEMGLDDQALDVLRWHKKDWTIREEIWELELLVSLRLFVETLSSTQNILQRQTEVEVVRAALYFSAHAYYGLNDPEQAKGILKGLLEHDPRYRDASILLNEWSLATP